LSNAVIVVRQLKHVRRTDPFLTALDSFVSDVDGLPYSITLGKLLRREPGASTDNFFCSELVAAAYMRVGLLDGERHSATAFYPSDFNEHNSTRLLDLQQGAELGPELLVEFKKPEVHEAKQNLSSSDDESPDAASVELQEAATAAAAAAKRAAEAKARRLESAARRARLSVASSPSDSASFVPPSSSPRDTNVRAIPPTAIRPPTACQPIVRTTGGSSAGNSSSRAAAAEAAAAARRTDFDDECPASLMQASSPAYLATNSHPRWPPSLVRTGSVEVGTLANSMLSFVPPSVLAAPTRIHAAATEQSDSEHTKHNATVRIAHNRASPTVACRLAATAEEEPVATLEQPSAAPASLVNAPASVLSSPSMVGSFDSPLPSSRVSFDLHAGVGVGVHVPPLSSSSFSASSLPAASSSPPPPLSSSQLRPSLDLTDGRGRNGDVAAFVLNEHYLAHGAVSANATYTVQLHRALPLLAKPPSAARRTPSVPVPMADEQREEEAEGEGTRTVKQPEPVDPVAANADSDASSNQSPH
jgi:hypothetical protein